MSGVICIKNIHINTNMFKTISKIVRHISAVRSAISLVIKELQRRADCHDDSKFTQEELNYYLAYENFPTGLEFGSKEYQQAEKKLNVGVGSPGFGLHSRRNDHHPEYYDCPEQNIDLSFMGLFALIEMTCDWCGAHLSYGNKGGWKESVQYNISRFDFNDKQKYIINEVADFLYSNHPKLKGHQ